jgi:hypothetical protein
MNYVCTRSVVCCSCVHQTQDKNQNKKQATFTFYSPKIRKLFKRTNIKIAFKNTNTIQQYTKPKTIDKNQDCNTSGIYKLTCNTCKMSYIGQNSRNLNQRYQEHICYIRNSDPPFCLHTAYTTKFTRIRIYYRHCVPTQTHT